MFDDESCASEIAQLDPRDKVILSACIFLALTHGADNRVNTFLRFVAESINCLDNDKIFGADILDFFTDYESADSDNVRFGYAS
jgi:hypothetical protein